MRWPNFFKKSRKPLTAKKVYFSYEDKQILNDLTFNIKENKITAIIGKSGSGKTTFLKIASGIITKKYGGKIKIFGKNKTFQKNKLGFVPQENAFIPDLTIAENVKVCGLNLGITEKQALKKSNELMSLLKFEENLNRSPQFLSGGQKTRLNIILSLLHDPQIIILDEPFVGLDFQNRRLLWHFLEKMKHQGKSILLTSHLLTETQEHVDQIILLKDGKVFFSGNLEKLKQKLKIKFIFEIRFSRLSKENLDKIKKFCAYKEIKILDAYEKYMMFSLNSEKMRENLLNFFKKQKLNFEEIGFREPNLDEVFLKT